MKEIIIGVVLLGLAMYGPLPAAGAEIEKGKKLYEERRCGICHVITGQGGKIGPDLSSVGNQRDREWLMRFLKDPKGTIPGAKMLPVKATEEELSALAAY
ncbi:MAG: c-type cytochrome, partial [Candidatus Manganitrophaceae bacterium]